MAVSLAKQKAIKKLLKEGAGIRTICRAESVSNTAIYTVMKECGIGEKKQGKEWRNDNGEGIQDDFVCPGLSGCVTCKRIFQPPCPMCTDAP